MRSLINRFVWAIKFVAARDCLMRGDFNRAFATAESIYRDYRCDAPSLAVPPTVNVIYALSAWNLHKPRETFEACGIAATQLLDRLPASRAVRSGYDCAYLIYYLKYLLQFAEHDFGVSSCPGLAALRAHSVTRMDLRKVQALLKRSFPIDQHWLESQWVTG